MRWQRPLLLVAGHIPHTTDTFQLRAGGTALRSTLLVSALRRISSPPAVLHGPPRSGIAQTLSTRSTLLVSALRRISSPPTGRMDLSAAKLPKPHPSDLFAPRSASMLHGTSPRAAITSPKIARRPVLFLRPGAEAYTRRATDEYTGINPSKDHRRGNHLLKEPIGLQTPFLTEPDRPSRDPLGLRAPCSRSSCRGSFFVVLPGKEQAVLVESLGLLIWRFFPVHALLYGFQYIRRSVLRVEQSAVLPFC